MKENTVMNYYDYYSAEIDAQVYLVGFEENINWITETNVLDDLLYSMLKKDAFSYLYRGTSLDRLPLIIQNGIDSDKVNQGFWGNRSLSKCLEYGQLILCYQGTKVKSSWKEYEISRLDENELQVLKKEFLSYEVTKDNSKIFFSMFDDNSRGRVHYEREHGYYVPTPETEKDCLKAVILLGCGEDWFLDMVTKFYKAGGTLQKDGKPLIDIEKLKGIIK